MWSPKLKDGVQKRSLSRKNKTLQKMLEISPTSPFAVDHNHQDFTNFHNVFRLKPRLPSRNLSIKLSGSQRTSVNNSPKTSPMTSPMASPGNSPSRQMSRKNISWKGSLVLNPFFDTKQTVQTVQTRSKF